MKILIDSGLGAGSHHLWITPEEEQRAEYLAVPWDAEMEEKDAHEILDKAHCDLFLKPMLLDKTPRLHWSPPHLS